MKICALYEKLYRKQIYLPQNEGKMDARKRIWELLVTMKRTVLQTDRKMWWYANVVHEKKSI